MQAFSNLAKTNNTILLPEKTGDIGAMVGQVCGFEGGAVSPQSLEFYT